MEYVKFRIIEDLSSIFKWLTLTMGVERVSIDTYYSSIDLTLYQRCEESGREEIIKTILKHGEQCPEVRKEDLTEEDMSITIFTWKFNK